MRSVGIGGPDGERPAGGVAVPQWIMKREGFQLLKIRFTSTFERTSIDDVLGRRRYNMGLLMLVFDVPEDQRDSAKYRLTAADASRRRLLSDDALIEASNSIIRRSSTLLSFSRSSPPMTEAEEQEYLEWQDAQAEQAVIDAEVKRSEEKGFYRYIASPQNGAEGTVGLSLGIDGSEP